MDFTETSHMDGRNARKNILDRIKVALQNPGKELPHELEKYTGFSCNQVDPVLDFSDAFEKLNGKLIACYDEIDLREKLSGLIEARNWRNIACAIPSILQFLKNVNLPLNFNEDAEAIEIGISECECLIARTGTIVLSSAQNSGRILPVYSPVHIVIASEKQLVFDIGDGIKHLKEKYNDKLPSALYFASGPSRTGDIERTLIIGVHGPIEVYVFLLNENPKK